MHGEKFKVILRLGLGFRVLASKQESNMCTYMHWLCALLDALEVSVSVV